MNHHKCPISGCDRQVPHHRLMCPLHWRCVPKGLADAVYRTWRKAPGGPLHQAAMRGAIQAVEGVTEPASKTQPHENR
jgi:hypothetical protein